MSKLNKLNNVSDLVSKLSKLNKLIKLSDLVSKQVS